MASLCSGAALSLLSSPAASPRLPDPLLSLVARASPLEGRASGAQAALPLKWRPATAAHARPARRGLPCRSATRDAGEGEDESSEKPAERPLPEGEEGDESGSGLSSAASEEFRARMEALVETQGKDEAYFDGKELAAIIFQKYGRSYDVTFMRQEFMGRKLLAMNVMWKYREQKSFPLSEEEYLYRLDRVAENLRFWGAVGLVRESLAATKERPRIGKAVSIRIDLDETGERAREWINR